MSEVSIWHNQKCSKSRAALELLQKSNYKITQVDYLQSNPSKIELEAILTMLNIPASGLIRAGEPIYKELNLTQQSSEEELISAMIEHPILIERPIVIKGNKAAIGRPVENIMELLK